MLATLSADDAPLGVGARASSAERLAGRYTLGEPLGAGGLGLVLAAHDHLLGLEVAIKWLRPDRPRADGRLADEVRLARRIRHPNVCAVFDLGEDGPRRFITMERVRGIALPEWLEAHAQDRARRRAIMSGIIDGVAAAHRCGVVHRDLKPNNVMVDDDGRPRVMDFGLAAEAALGATERVGTPHWWAPEQHAGAPATRRTDVFALGRIAEWLLFDADRSTRRWIRRCMDEAPARRFADAGALQTHLRRRPARRFITLAGGLLALIALVAAVDYAVEPRPAGSSALAWGQHSIAHNQMASSIDQLRIAIAADPELAPAYLWLGYAHSWLGQTIQARAAIDEALLRSEQLTEDDRLLLLALNARLQHDIPRARALLDRLLERSPAHPAGLFTRADLDYHAGRFGPAAERLERLVIAQPRNARAWDHLMWARLAHDGPDAGEAVALRWIAASRGQLALEARAVLRVATGRPAEAEIKLAMGERWGDADPPTLRAIEHLEEGRPDAALAMLQAHSRRIGHRRPNYADMLRRMGWVRLAEGAFDAARALYADARAATADWRPSVSSGKPGFEGILAAELAWGLAAMGAEPSDPTAGALAERPALIADRHAATYLALACLIRDDRRCLEATAPASWPIVRAIRRAHEQLAFGETLRAAELLRQAAGQTTLQARVALWLAASELAGRAGALDHSRADLNEAARYRFATPQSVIARALWRRAAR